MPHVDGVGYEFGKIFGVKNIVEAKQLELNQRFFLITKTF